ncbi:MAG: DUF4139 domain-containing protein [Polyangiaceae bacterium]
MANEKFRGPLSRRSVVALVACAGTCLATSTGCASRASFVHAPDTTLGRVVVYRNGVAYFERTANVDGDTLHLAVPGDKVDDFLKSLTVSDAATGTPAPVSWGGPAPGRTGTIDMKVSLPKGHHTVNLTYVTESPSWKPSYRVTLGEGGKVELQGWAVVDNTSGEDWKNVRLGVGASSAMSFRFDLSSLRTVERETLHSNDRFAAAPPTGGATFGGGARKVVLSEIGDATLLEADRLADDRSRPMQPVTKSSGVKVERTAGGRGASSATAQAPVAAGAPSRSEPLDLLVAQVNRQLALGSANVVVEGFASGSDADKDASSLARANRLRDQLVRKGVDAGKIVAIGRGTAPGKEGGARILDGATPASSSGAAPGPGAAADGEPIGSSHFESDVAMSVTKGSSAMVSILKAKTDGQVVYLYEPEGPRGNANFPFKAVRLSNPTDSALESGPFTVFGAGRFIGEGLSEPIPAKSVAFVPFALDRQVLVERKGSESDAIARILTVSRGVFSTETQHKKKTHLLVTNKNAEAVVVYVKHAPTSGYTTIQAPPRTERIGLADVYRVDVPANGTANLEIEEATPVLRSCDIRTPEGSGLVRAYLSSAALEGPLQKDVAKLLDVQEEMGKIETQIATTREQMGEYRTRMDELHAQLVTLKAVRTAGPLMTHLERKLQDVSESLSKATVDVVGLEERRMLARIRFQDGVAELTLDRTGASDATPATLVGSRENPREPRGPKGKTVSTR